MRRLVLICSCSGRKEKALSAYRLLFPNTPEPEVFKGRDNLAKLAKELSNDHIKAVSRLTGKFSYYVELDDNNSIIKEYDLMTGRRIA